MLTDKRTRRMIIGLVCGTLLLIGLTLLVFKFLASDRLEQPVPDKSENVIAGEFLNWAEVDKLFPKQARAEVIDVDTGLQFQIQRRGGYNHADVQPLTAVDTAIMKKIYNGQWSWKRRAVIIQLPNGPMIAASMNGMPHGQGAIKGNNFNGHFCVHFKDSKTHGSKKADQAHQMMVWKAARVLDQQMRAMTAEEAISLFFTAVDQHELNIAGQLLNFGTDAEPGLKILKNIEDMKAENIKKIGENIYSANIKVVFCGSRREFRQDIIIDAVEDETNWKIEAGTIIPQLDKGSWAVFEQIGVTLPEDEDWEPEINME